MGLELIAIRERGILINPGFLIQNYLPRLLISHKVCKIIMTRTRGGSYSQITSMLAFIMREAVLQSPYTSKHPSKDVSMEDDPMTLSLADA